MLQQVSVTRIRPESAGIARKALLAAALLGLAALAAGNPTFADEPAEAAQATARNADSDEMSERQRRREERRQARDAERATAATVQAEAAGNDESEFVVYVEPEIECRTVQVTGSRMPKQVCAPVGQSAQDEQDAQDFLRRTRELSTVIPEDERNNPFISPSVFN